MPEIMDELKQFCINLLLYPAKELGWDPSPGESHTNTLLRGEVFEGLAHLGHEETHKEAIRRFQAFLKDNCTKLLPADARKAAYVAVVQNATIQDREGFDTLLNMYKETDVLQERKRLLGTIASSLDPHLVLEALNLTLSDDVDVIYVLYGISAEGNETAWQWLKDNWAVIFEKIGSGRGMLLTHFIRDIVTPLSSFEVADEAEEFLSRQPIPTVTKTIKQSIEHIRIKERWVKHIQQEPALSELIKRLASK